MSVSIRAAFIPNAQRHAQAFDAENAGSPLDFDLPRPANLPENSTCAEKASPGGVWRRDVVPAGAWCGPSRRLWSTQAIMASRNRTRQFLGLRGEISARRPRNEQRTEIRTRALPPAYVDVVELLDMDLVDAKKDIARLRGLHSKRLRVSFGGRDEKRQDREIAELASDIRQLLGRCEANLKRVADTSEGGDGRTTSVQDRVCRYNIMRSYASRIIAISRTFKEAQRTFVRERRRQSEFGDDLIRPPSPAGGGPGGGRQAQVQLRRGARQTEEDEEIDQLVESIRELSSLFKELSVLVIDQGTVLDRIDYNVELVHDRTTQGVREMERAYAYSKNNCSSLCILGNVGVLIILLVVIVWKYS